MKTIVSTAIVVIGLLLVLTKVEASSLLFGDPEEQVFTGITRKETNAGATSDKKFPPVRFVFISCFT